MSLDQAHRYGRGFHDFSLFKGVREPFEEFPMKKLDNYLRFFYAKLRSDDGAYLSPAYFFIQYVCIN